MFNIKHCVCVPYADMQWPGPDHDWFIFTDNRAKNHPN